MLIVTDTISRGKKYTHTHKKSYIYKRKRPLLTHDGVSRLFNTRNGNSYSAILLKNTQSNNTVSKHTSRINRKK